MNKNTLIGFVLIAVVLIGFSMWGQKQAAEQQAAAEAAAKQEQQNKPQEEAPKDSAAVALAAEQKLQADSARTFFNALQEQALDSVVLKNDKVELTIYNKGGVVKKAKILGYKDYKGNADVTLFDDKDQSLSFALPANAKKEIIK